MAATGAEHLPGAAAEPGPHMGAGTIITDVQDQQTGPAVPVPQPSLAQKVSAIIQDSTSERNHKYFNPPTEARYLSNRNLARETKGPMSHVGEYELPIGPADITLDSTSCPSNFDHSLTYVSFYGDIDSLPT